MLQISKMDWHGLELNKKVSQLQKPRQPILPSRNGGLALSFLPLVLNMQYPSLGSTGTPLIQTQTGMPNWLKNLRKSGYLGHERWSS